jgi:adenine-specific DNA methylase
MGMLPTTRYVGSKRKIVDWIWRQIKDLSFDCFLDAFGGTGVVGYFVKMHGKRVVFNDVLKFNYLIGLTLIENEEVKLSESEIDFLLREHGGIAYPAFIRDTFKGLYYTDEENRWLDMVVTNISLLGNRFKRALAFSALGQACLVKRPFNLFHRKNLYFRLKHVKRGFRNDKTWNRSFEEHFRRFVDEYNSLVFSNGRRNEAYNLDVFDLDFVDADMVYLDPPYLPKSGEKPNYFVYYHFLEGLVNYNRWKGMIDPTSELKAIKYVDSPWIDKSRVRDAFDRLFRIFKFANYIVVSYRCDGVPSVSQIRDMLRSYKSNVLVKRKSFRYVLSKNSTDEVLFIAY